MLLRLALSSFIAAVGLAVPWYGFAQGIIGSSQTIIPSDETRATVAGDPSKALDSRGLQNFDQCRAGIPLEKLSIEEV